MELKTHSGLKDAGKEFRNGGFSPAQGTTHGFERGYDAFLGDPFGIARFNESASSTAAFKPNMARAAA